MIPPRRAAPTPPQLIFVVKTNLLNQHLRRRPLAPASIIYNIYSAPPPPHRDPPRGWGGAEGIGGVTPAAPLFPPRCCRAGGGGGVVIYRVGGARGGTYIFIGGARGGRGEEQNKVHLYRPDPALAARGGGAGRGGGPSHARGRCDWGGRHPTLPPAWMVPPPSPPPIPVGWGEAPGGVRG